MADDDTSAQLLADVLAGGAAAVARGAPRAPATARIARTESQPPGTPEVVAFRRGLAAAGAVSIAAWTVVVGVVVALLN
jgi:hypothetical protein